MAFLICIVTALQAQADDPRTIEMKIIGGLGGLKQYDQFEAPFWREMIGKLSNGQIRATVHPFDKSGLRGEDMLQLIRMGVVPFGTVLMGLVVSDEPELNGVYLASLGMNGHSVRSTVDHYRPHMRDLLRKRYGIELLAVYPYPAQVTFCIKPFRSLADLGGRRIRTSHVSQADLMMALGATPVVMPFHETAKALKRGDIDCAITGTSAGNEAELFTVTGYVSDTTITPGLSVFAANSQAWSALPDEARKTITAGLSDLENRMWQAAEADTLNGIACNTGSTECKGGKLGRMKLVTSKVDDEKLLRTILANRLLPDWIDRCGNTCVTTWNELMAGRTGLKVSRDNSGTLIADPQSPSHTNRPDRTSP